MKRTLIASAIAAATFSGAALAQESNLPTVYGDIEYVVVHDNFDRGPSTIDHIDNGSTLGILHEHQITPNLTGFFKAEFKFVANDKSNSDGISRLDEAYVGVKGDEFGKIWIGSDDSLYEETIDEIHEFFELKNSITLNIGGLYDTGEGDLVQYLSPSFSGLTLGAAVQINGDNSAGGKAYPWQLSAAYEIDAFELAFAIDSNDGKREYSSNNVSGINAQNNENTYGFRGSYDLYDMRVTGQYQIRKDVADIYGLMGVYVMGRNQFALAYEYSGLKGDAKRAADGEHKRETVTLQALHNVSDNLYVYVEGYYGGGDKVYGYNEYKDADGNTAYGDYTDERSIAAVGLNYYF